MQWAEDNKQLTPYQGGGQRGHSAIDLACKKVVAYEYVTFNRITAANFEYDLKQCFDNMNKVCAKLSCLQHGTDPQYIWLHAQTQKLQCYHIKHAYSISNRYNQHTEQHPWYSAGQGTGDAASCWVVQLHSLLTAYHAEAHTWNLSPPTSEDTIRMGIDAYMDDTNQILGDTATSKLNPLLTHAQDNIDLWQGLIQASGGTLNPTKCSWTPFLWEFDKIGNARLLNPPDREKYHIMAPDHQGKQHKLTHNQPHTTVWLLGVHIAADGNSDTKYSTLQKRQTQYSTFLQHTPMTWWEVWVIYWQCYLPKVTYPLPATNMSLDKIYKTQLRVMAQFLNKMGYPVSFPWAVVYAPGNVGGLGFQHLGHEQGIQHILQLLKHLWASTLNGQLYSALIDTYQIRASCARHILEYTELLPWCLNGWLTTTRQFLNNINTTITLHHPWVPLPCQVNDHNIMDDVICLMPNANAEAINNVRLYLCIFFLSEITEANGTTVLPDILQQSPWHSGSTIQWPRQPMPPPEAWRHWQRAIQTMYLRTNSDHLVTPLKEWTEHVNMDWMWEWQINPATLELYQRSGEQWYSCRPAIHQRTYIAYDTGGQCWVWLDPTTMPPATPSFDTSQTYITVQLPITTTNSQHQPMVHPVVPNLLDRLCTPPTQWAAPLWHRICPTAPVDALLYHVQRQNTLILSSDASVDTAKHSCCAWSLHGDVTLWQGKGIVPGNCNDMYSGQSKAFGLLMALMFLQHYLKQFPLTQSTTLSQLVVYCDNGGTITMQLHIPNKPNYFPIKPYWMITMSITRLVKLLEASHNFWLPSFTSKDIRIKKE